jgi:antitoxin (DNA-binding transcriptional repressor) of toxin-antitoxin stability system
MNRMSASKFKSRCLSVISMIEKTGEPVLVTKRGKPHVRIERVEPDDKSILGFLAGEVEIVGDIEAPINYGNFPKRSKRSQPVRRRRK